MKDKISEYQGKYQEIRHKIGYKMMMETICSYEQSTRLKRLGFDWPCWSVYHKQGNGRIFLDKSKTQADNWNAGIYFSAPSMEVAHRWLREVMQLCITVSPQMDANGHLGYGFYVYYLPEFNVVGGSHNLYGTYEAAMSAAMDYAIECAVIQYRKKTSNIR